MLKPITYLILATVAIAIVVLSVTPQPLMAEPSCTLAYQACIAEAGLLEGIEQVMADIECGVNWAACVSPL